MTTIAELATQTIERTSTFDLLPSRHLAENEKGPICRDDVSKDALLRLDARGWGRLFAELDVDRQVVRQLDRLVATWRSHQDYRRLRQMALDRRHEPQAKATEALLSEWVTEEDCKRLGHLVVGLGFSDPELPICYSLCSALRAVQSSLNYAKSDEYLNEEEIEAARNELFESSDEYQELASLGMTEESP